jgi:hypothetical protein
MCCYGPLNKWSLSLHLQIVVTVLQFSCVYCSFLSFNVHWCGKQYLGVCLFLILLQKEYIIIKKMNPPIMFVVEIVYKRDFILKRHMSYCAPC